MESADRLSANDLSRLQQARLRKFIEYCYAHVPYVRRRMQDAGVAPAQILGPEDLRLLPLTGKDEIRKHRLEFRSDIAAGLTPFATGGSTGEPLIFDLAKRRVAARVACRQRVARWWGLSVGDAEIALWGSPIEISRQQHLQNLRDRLLATRLLSAFEMNEATMDRYLDILAGGRWKQVFGYPSAVYLLCVQARKRGLDLRRVGVKTVFVTGEVLFPYQRDLITETLGCPVADGYGGRDSGFIAHQCPQGGMHLLTDCNVIEILGPDGEPVPPGESGEIVVTDLYSHEFPFLRYRTGDMGALSSRPCPCGRPLPLMERIEGRSNDSIVSPDGRIINSLALIYAVRELAGIERFRVRQKQPDCFHVEIVRGPGFPEDAERRIERAWTQLLRSPLTVTFEYLPVLPVEASGKFRHVISDVPIGQDIRRQGCAAIN